MGQPHARQCAQGADVMEASKFPSQVSDEFVVHYVADMNDKDPDDPDGAEVPHNIRRFQGYCLKQVPLSDIFFENESFSASLAQAYADMSAVEAPPIILDGITLAPLDGFHRTNAARLRGDTHVLAYVGHTPRADWEPFEPDDAQGFQNAAALHQHLLSSVQPKAPGQTQDPSKMWGAQAQALLGAGVQLEYVDAKGMTLLGAAVQAVLMHRDTAMAEALLAAGANPNRLSKFPNQVSRRSAWEEVLRYHHPNPSLYDPEHELPMSLLQAFLANGLDLKRPDHDAVVTQWLAKKKGSQAVSGSVEILERTWRQARLDTALPSPQRSGARPRM